MKKRFSLLVLTLTLLVSGVDIQAAERNPMEDIAKYADDFLNEVYEEYGEEIKENFEKEKDKVVKEAGNMIKEEINKSVSDYFSDFVSNLTAFFKGLFK